jgi:TfoX/Sxy family transcriptional regulator of competence genes
MTLISNKDTRPHYQGDFISDWVNLGWEVKMAYNLGVAGRIREALKQVPDLSEKKMFGGVAFLVRGNMACGVHRDSLIVRVGLEQNQAALSRSGARPFDLTGKPMAGWVAVDPEGYSTESSLQEWIREGVDFASSLPAK